MAAAHLQAGWDTSRESQQHIYRLAGEYLQAGWGTSTGWLGSSTGWLTPITDLLRPFYRLAGQIYSLAEALIGPGCPRQSLFTHIYVLCSPAGYTYTLAGAHVQAGWQGTAHLQFTLWQGHFNRLRTLGTRSTHGAVLHPFENNIYKLEEKNYIHP